MEIKVLFIYPNNIGAIQEPLGLSYLSAILKSYGIDTKLFDYTFQNRVDLINILRSYRPHFICVSALSSNYKLGLELAKLCKDYDPNIKIIFGGIHPTLCPSEVIKVPYIDAVCVGESDLTLPKYILLNGDDVYIDGMYIRDHHMQEKIIYNDYTIPPDLNEIDNLIDCKPDHGLFQRHFNKDFYGHTGILGMFLASRGCPFNCSYCSNHILKQCYDYSTNGKWTRYRKVENVIREIENSIRQFNIDHIYFADDTMTFNKKYVTEFCNQYKTNIFDIYKIPFYCMLRADSVDEDIIESLANAGCKRVLIGIESGSERIRNQIYNKNITDKQIIIAIELAHKYGILVTSFNMISPMETIEDAEETLKLNLFCNVDDAKMTILNAFPHTKLYNDIQEGKYPGCTISDNKMPENYYEKTNIINPNMTLQQMSDFQERFYKTVRYRWYG